MYYRSPEEHSTGFHKRALLKFNLYKYAAISLSKLYSAQTVRKHYQKGPLPMIIIAVTAVTCEVHIIKFVGFPMPQNSGCCNIARYT